MALRWVDGVTLEDTWATRTIAETHHSAVEAEIRLCLAIAGVGALVDKFVVVRLAAQILSRVRQRRERERLVNGLDAETLSLLGTQFDVGAVLVVTRVLRTGLVDILLRDRRLPQANGARLFAIRIVVPRSATIPRQLFVLAGQLNKDAQTRQWG